MSGLSEHTYYVVRTQQIVVLLIFKGIESLSQTMIY